MNKEFNDNNYQPSPHHEGQQGNIAHDGQGRGVNEPPEAKEVKNSQQQSSNQRGETESERANENEDEGLRGGNSSI